MSETRLWHRARCGYAELEDRLNELSASKYFTVIDILALPDGDFLLLYLDTHSAFEEPIKANGIEDATGDEPLSKLQKLDEV